MNWEAISSLSELIGAVAVVISLIYVAIEIRQNTKATRFQTTQQLISANAEANYLISSDTELASIMRKGLMDRSSLDEEEEIRFNTWLISSFKQFDFAYHQFVSGELDKQFWETMDYELPIWVASLPGIAEWWDQDKQRLTPGFVEYIEKRAAEVKPSQIVPTVPKRAQRGT